MQRRRILTSALGLMSFAAAVGVSTRSKAEPEKAKQKVVYHLSDVEKVTFVLGNIQNHIAGVGGPEYVDIVLVKVVYHLSDVEKVTFVLGNIQNHIAGVGGPEYVDIVLVVHGPALKSFHKMMADPDVRQAVDNLKEEGVDLNACANTMKAQHVDENGLLPGFVKVDQGGVVRIAQLQGDGYVYIRP